MDVARLVDAPIEKVWRILAGTQHWTVWGPSVREVDPPDATVTPGLTGRVRTPVGVWVPFEITEVEPDGPQRRWAWRVAGIAATGHRVESVDDGTTRVVFEIPRWAPAYALVCRVALTRIDEMATSAR